MVGVVVGKGGFHCTFVGRRPIATGWKPATSGGLRLPISVTVAIDCKYALSPGNSADCVWMRGAAFQAAMTAFEPLNVVRDHATQGRNRWRGMVKFRGKRFELVPIQQST